MTKHIHFIAVGEESVKMHLAGLPRFKADEVVLFSPEAGARRNRQAVMGLKRMGVAYRVVNVKKGYVYAYRKANEEAAASFTDDSCIAINMSTGASVVLSAIEDAVRIQLYYFHRRAKGPHTSAFRYFVNITAKEKKKGKTEQMCFTVAPIWNFQAYLHNDIFDVLTEAEQPITLGRIYESLMDALADEAPSHEAFRKIFRDFKRWFKNSPCYMERLGKSPEYQITLL